MSEHATQVATHAEASKINIAWSLFTYDVVNEP